MRKPTILMLCDYYLPGYKAGGAARSVANMVEHLGEEFCFRVVTRDRDLGDSSPYPNCPRGVWTKVARADVIYLPPAEFGVAGLRNIISRTEHDVLYLSSFFHPRLTVVPVVLRRFNLIPSRPVVLAPHGEFSLGALSLKSMKKRVFVHLARILRLYHGVIWHASSSLEGQDIRRVFGGAQEVQVARDLPTLASPDAGAEKRRSKRPGALNIVFLSRVSRMKNLDGALRMLRALRGQVHFHIYGPRPDPTYWIEVLRLIQALPTNIHVAEHGPIPMAEVPSVLCQHDLFFLPTHGENFGHVVLEALGAGCPVLLSDQTIWRGLEKNGVGWDIPLAQPEEFHRVLQRCIDMGDEEFLAISARATRYAESVVADPLALDQNRRVLEMAARRGAALQPGYGDGLMRRVQKARRPVGGYSSKLRWKWSWRRGAWGRGRAFRGGECRRFAPDDWFLYQALAAVGQFDGAIGTLVC